MQYADDNLVERLKNRDEAAFAELVGKYERFVFNTALQSVKNYDDASDISQEVFVKVYRSIGGFKGNSTVSTWLYRITVNVCIDFSRKNKLYKNTTAIETEDDEGERYEIPLPDYTYNPELKLENKELSAALQKAVNSLPSGSKEIIIMRDINGMTYNEIAEALGIELGTVRSRLARARIKLRNKLLKIL